MRENIVTGLMLAVAVLGVVALFWVTTPNMDDLPEFTCNPGSHHTTKECQ